jgi:MFS family permease
MEDNTNDQNNINGSSMSDVEKPNDGTGEEPTVPQGGRPPFSFLKEVAFLTTIILAQIITLCGLGQALAPIHHISDRFQVTDNGEQSWYVASFSLTVGTFILIAGRLGDMYGHKRIFMIGFLFCGLWSIIAGAGYYVSTDKLFVVSRAFQGIGVSLMLPNAIAILSRTYPPGPRKNMVVSLFGAAAPSGFLIGAFFSSLIAQHIAWSWAYFITGIVCFVIALASTRTIPADRLAQTGKFDFAGSILGVTGMVLFNVAWNQGPNVGWSTPYVYVLLILGVLAIALFVWVERQAECPLLPMDVLNLRIGLTLASLAAGWASFSIWLYYLWQFLGVVRGLSPLTVTAQNVPSTISGLAAAITTAILISRIGIPYIMVMALVSFCATTILVATMPADQTYWAQTFVSFALMPWGMEMSFPTATIMASCAVPVEHQGIAASMVFTTTNYAISIGLGIAGTVVSNVDPGGENVLNVCRHAWYTGIGLSGLGIVIAVISAVYQRKVEVTVAEH